MNHTFLAQYKGQCDACDGPIRKGERVRYTDDLGVVHDVCPDPDRLVAERPMCPFCHLELPMSGECCA